MGSNKPTTPPGSSGIPAAASPPERRKARALTPRLLEWFTLNARDLPWRRTRDPYAIWVSEIMLQQTQVRTVIPYYERWMKSLPTVHTLARASSQRLHKLWEGLGYYTRVRNMQKAARLICSAHQGRFPVEFDEVLGLPGIGRYTAGAICSIAFNQPAPILDGNVIRVLTRVFGITGDPKAATTNAHLWRLAESLVSAAAGASPQSNIVSRQWATVPCSALNQSLMELGATICTPRDPACLKCPARRACIARRDDRVEELPAVRSRPRTITRHLQAFVLRQQDRYLAVQRPRDGVNGGLWEFPSVEMKQNGSNGQAPVSRVAGLGVRDARLLGSVRHSITRYRITMDVYCAKPNRSGNGEGKRWVTLAQLKRLPLSAAHRRIANMLPPD